ncbi:MAG: hypothetical protein KGL90_05410 [Burkholderiales bacterium]|nr:hypothetical protein [Burkholderiales bacterium]
MARALISAHLLGWALLGAAPAALALGPSAPFVPPTPPTASASDPALATVETPSSTGLAGLKLGRQPQALIDGLWVAQGATVRDGSVLTAIKRRAVQLRHPDGTIETLELSPGVEMARSSSNAHIRTRKP